MPNGLNRFAMVGIDLKLLKGILIVSACISAPLYAQEIDPCRNVVWRRATPSMANESGLAVDIVTDKVVRYGGSGNSTNGTLNNETWVWVGNDEWDWIAAATQQVEPDSPGYREQCAMASNPGGGVVLFGGNVEGPIDESDRWTYVLENGLWRVASSPPSHSPPRLRSAAMAYSPVGGANGIAVLFGGLDLVSSTALDQTWIWNGSSWSGPLQGTGPSARYGSAMAWDPQSQRIILFGGGLPRVNDEPIRYCDTWAFNPIDNTWQQIMGGCEGSNVAPSARVDHAMATLYTEANPRIILFGGNLLDSVDYDDRNSGEWWSFAAGVWQRLGPNTGDTYPAKRAKHRMASQSSDPRTGLPAIVMHGGNVGGYRQFFDVNGDTWVFDGHAWTVRSWLPAESQNSTLVYDDNRGVSILFGGLTNGAYGPNQSIASSHIYEWDGKKWRYVERQPCANPPCDDGPPGMHGHAATFDPLRNKMVVVAGEFVTYSVLEGYQRTQNRETWEWDTIERRWQRFYDERLDCNHGTGRLFPIAQSAIVYSSVHNAVVLHAGYSNCFNLFEQSPSHPANIWIRQTAEGQPPWRKETPAPEHESCMMTQDTGPCDSSAFNSMLSQHVMTFDENRNTILVYSGGCLTGAGSDNVYEVEMCNGGYRWRTVTPMPGTPITERAAPTDILQGIYLQYATVAYANQYARSVLFGGFSNGGGVQSGGRTGCSSSTNDVWTWRGPEVGQLQGQWLRHPRNENEPAPYSRFSHSMSWDRRRGVGVVFGGIGCSGRFIGDTWEYSFVMPAIVEQPVDMRAYIGIDSEYVFELHYTPNNGNCAISWFLDDQLLSDGNGISGATANRLRIDASYFTGEHTGQVRAVVACGGSTCVVNSRNALLQVVCVADWNGSGGVPDDADIDAYFTDWSAGDPRADVNRSGGTPDDADLALFMHHWNLGC